MKTRNLLLAVFRLPDLKNSFLSVKQAFALMNECQKHNLFEELVQIENIVGIEKGYLKQESLKLELRHRLQFL